ncbi:DUF4350 domain-containing protein [Hymenobacter sp. BT507]|uniref:DUF4350 domain-containing protein n=1 Tax=Hymenobacter citatus TaxID=2763506 RepID=A0ABR7MJQ6_9BACT|nr:DUF4350 domain-containing protein [Hymenobacter citatus]MBC6610783.1 DUF4350 domain-containing protein [Hymenobacter citatus]
MLTPFRAYLIGLGVLFAAYVLVEYLRPTPTDWTPTYLNRDKIPYGTYVLHQVLPDLFGRKPVRTVRQPIANQLLRNLGDTARHDSTATPRLIATNANYVFVAPRFRAGRLDEEVLLRYVARGNAVFIAAEQLGRLSDTLRLATEPEYPANVQQSWKPGSAPPPDTTTITWLRAPAGAPRSLRLPQPLAAWHFVADSGCVAQVLAENEQHQPVLVRVPVGRGAIYLSSTPIAFTNYFVLRPGTSRFAFAALSYLPVRPVFWDEYQKQGPVGDQSLFRVVRQHPALRQAGWLMLIGTLLFAFFEARRRQRVIPVIKALPNTTLLFTRTVASLYRQGSNHALIAEKRIELFLETIRTRLQEPTTNLNDDAFRERVAQKTGVARSQVDELIRLIHFIRTAPTVSDQQLLQLSKALNEFRKQAFI